jgi:hypothetical protein
VTEETKSKANGAAPAAAAAVVDERLVAELVARAGSEGVSLTGEGGLLQQLTELVLESSLEGEMDAHLGYGKHDPAGRDGVHTEEVLGSIDIQGVRYSSARIAGASDLVRSRSLGPDGVSRATGLTSSISGSCWAAESGPWLTRRWRSHSARLRAGSGRQPR